MSVSFYRHMCKALLYQNALVNLPVVAKPWKKNQIEIIREKKTFDCNKSFKCVTQV